MNRIRLFGSLLLFAASTFSPAYTQSNEEQGMKPYDSWHGGDLDSISMTNGGMVLHIPLASFPQRGNLGLTFSLLSNTKQWQLATACSTNQVTGEQTCNSKWEPLPRGSQIPNYQGIITIPNLPLDGVYVASSLDTWLSSYVATEPQDPNNPGPTLYDWTYNIVSPDGNAHQLASATSSFSTTPIYPLRSLDASGILAPDGNTLIMPNGTRYSYVNGGSGSQYFCCLTTPSSVTDANGNQITINNSSGAFGDTMGRSIPAPPGTAAILGPTVTTSRRPEGRQR